MQNLKVAVLQSSIHWNDIDKNIEYFSKHIKQIKQSLDLIVLPEMFSTGFNMNPDEVYETMNSNTVSWMLETAKNRKSVVTGSLLIKENGNFYNRLFWVYPNGKFETYDKKHLFSFAKEDKVFTPGNERVIVTYKGIRFLLCVCYDLRFPVWLRNTYNEGQYDYDVIVCVANWPEARSFAWKSLLTARAIENQAFVIGVNRVGVDFNDIKYAGDSRIICPKGEILASVNSFESFYAIAKLDMSSLENFRNKFFIAADWDRYKIIE